MKFEPIDLTPYNGYRIRSTARRGIVPDGEQALIEALRTYPSATIIGSGHNLILSQAHYEQTFIILNLVHASPETLEIEGCRLSAYAGLSMLNLSLAALQYALAGLEMFYDIPSSLGGAIVMNAGANGQDIAPLVDSVRVFDRNSGSVRTLEAEELGHGYRTSVFHKRQDLVILSANLVLERGDASIIRQRMEQVKEVRWQKQPRDRPNAGSVFKRPAGRFVGPMLDELGLRGMTLGGAQVSTKHSGFIVNAGNATGADVLELIAFIQDKVRTHFGVDLQPEQVVV